MRVERFEQLDAWQRARELTREVYGVTATGTFSRDFGLRDQIRRAAISIMSNIAEGFERGTTKDNHRFVCIAKASAAEVRSQLYVALDAGHVDRNTFDDLQALGNEVSRLLGGYRAALARRIDQP
ncbi:MAG: four helix bundle protein [Planctomycetota bacterium]